MHLYKSVEWEANGKWLCGDTSDLAHNSNAWYLPCRILGISPAEFIKQLKEIYHCDNISWKPDTADGHGFLFFSWSKQADMRKFKNYLNKVARDKQFYV